MVSIISSLNGHSSNNMDPEQKGLLGQIRLTEKVIKHLLKSDGTDSRINK